MPAALAAAAALALASPNAAVVHAGDAVPGHPGLTYLDLAKAFAPTLAPDVSGALVGHLPATVRHLAGKSAEGDEPDPVTLGFLQDERIMVGGKPRIALIADFGPDPDRVQSATFLLLFDDGPTPRLLDAADVSLAEDTEYDQPPKVALGPGDDALIVYSEHDDADLSDGAYVMVSAEHDRLAMIDSFRVTSVRACGWTATEGPIFTAAPDPGHALRRLDVAVTVAVTHPTGDDACAGTNIPRAQTRTFHSSYRWNPVQHRFDRIGGGLAGLDALNAQLFK